MIIKLWFCWIVVLKKWLFLLDCKNDSVTDAVFAISKEEVDNENGEVLMR